MGEIMALLPSLAVPGSALGALVIGAVSLMRMRSTDREALSTSQRQYIDNLVRAREAADVRADKFIEQLDAERLKRIEAEMNRVQAESRADALQRRVEALEGRLQSCACSTGDTQNS